MLTDWVALHRAIHILTAEMGLVIVSAVERLTRHRITGDPDQARRWRQVIDQTLPTTRGTR